MPLSEETMTDPYKLIEQQAKALKGCADIFEGQLQHGENEQVKELRALIAEADAWLASGGKQEPVAWQPIETAPRTGEYFLTGNFYNPLGDLGEYEVARYDPRTYETFEEAGNGLYRPVTKPLCDFSSDNFHRATHWMPLPAPPKEGGKS